jgi:isopenicillin N synthase-like dioxygenase
MFSLGLGEDYFVAQFNSRAPSFARFNYYPPCPSPRPEDLVFGVKPHSDSGVLTILLIDKDVGGLQVLRDGVWHNVPASSPFRLLINVGDFVEVPYSSIVLLRGCLVLWTKV